MDPNIPLEASEWVALHLDSKTLKKLSKTSSDVSTLTQKLEKDPHFWKTKLETLLDVKIPNETDIDWKTAYVYVEDGGN
jgi:hypothetical protein